MDYVKLGQKSDDEEDDIEHEEKDPVFPTQVEPIQGNDDKRQDQGQTQSSCKDPRQQSLCFKLRKIKQTSINIIQLETVS